MTLTRFNDSPPDTHSNLAPDSGEKIMHAALRIGDSTILFSDGSPGTEFKGFSLALTPSNAAEAERVFAALADGGAIQVPLAKTFFAPLFGWVTDRFGLSWMIALEP